MKSSKYNFFFPLNDGKNYIAYNTMTNGLAVIDNKHYEVFQKFVNSGEEICEESFIDDLKRGSFLIDDDFNELYALKFKLLSSRYSTNSLSLTIAPTTNCNFACVYCYEKDSNKDNRMTAEVQDSLIKYIEKNIKYIDNLNITWYGGEPLIAFNIIEKLSNKIIKMCDDNKINYNADIITNGYELTAEIANALKKLRVTHAQVTLDGTPEIHNSRRPLKGGQPTFYTILKNIISVKDIIDINIRVNTDKSNSDKLQDILDILKKNGLEKAFLYLGYVEPTNGCCDKSNCMCYKDFSDLSFQFHKDIIEQGFIKKDGWLAKYPQIKGTYCGADSYSSIVVAPNGDLYKCWSDIGIKKYCIGNISESNTENKYPIQQMIKYITYDPTDDPECKECKYIPICMGGCPKRRLEKNDGRCVEYKYNLESYINKVAMMLYEKSQK